MPMLGPYRWIIFLMFLVIVTTVVSVYEVQATDTNWLHPKVDCTNSGFAEQPTPDSNKTYYWGGMGNPTRAPTVRIGDNFYRIGQYSNLTRFSYETEEVEKIAGPFYDPDIWFPEVLVGDTSNERLYIGTDRGIIAFNILTLQLEWETDIFDEAYPPISLVQDEENIYVAIDAFVSCIRKNDGEIQWTERIGRYRVYWPSLVSDQVLVGNDLGQLVSLDKTNGVTNWAYDFGNVTQVKTPVVNGDYVLVVVGDYLHRLRLIFGEAPVIDWSFQGETFMGDVSYNRNATFVFDTYNVYCLDTDSGSEIWTYNLEEGYRFNSANIYRRCFPLIVTESVVIVNTITNISELRVINVSDGVQLYSTGSGSNGYVILYDGLIFTGTGHLQVIGKEPVPLNSPRIPDDDLLIDPNWLYLIIAINTAMLVVHFVRYYYKRKKVRGQ